MLVDTADLHHFNPLPVTLTLAEGHKVEGKQKPVRFIFVHTTN